MKKKLGLCMTLLAMMPVLSGCASDFGSKMAKAGMNTVMGMGTVFIVLILFAFIISRFKYISVFEKWLNSRGHKDDVPKLQPMPPAAEPEEEEPADDLELVAVITAALAASLNTSTDKLIVRSIRRRNSNHW